MGSDVKKAYGAEGRDELLWFDPWKLTIVEDKDHPLFDERVKLDVDEALVLNIMVHGVIEPVVVRKNGEVNGEPLVEVIDGRQRVRAAREANMRLHKEGKTILRVPAVRRRGDDSDLLGVMISTNEQRRDDSVLVKAKKAARYRAMGKSASEAALAFGVTVQTIHDWEALNECAPEVKKAVERGEVAAAVARGLKKLPREQQPAALAKLVASGETKGKRGERAAARETGREVQRMLGRKEVEALRATLKAADEAPEAVTVLGWVLKGEVPKKWQAAP